MCLTILFSGLYADTESTEEAPNTGWKKGEYNCSSNYIIYASNYFHVF